MEGKLRAVSSWVLHVVISGWGLCVAAAWALVEELSARCTFRGLFLLPVLLEQCLPVARWTLQALHPCDR